MNRLIVFFLCLSCHLSAEPSGNHFRSSLNSQEIKPFFFRWVGWAWPFGFDNPWNKEIILDLSLPFDLPRNDPSLTTFILEQLTELSKPSNNDEKKTLRIICLTLGLINLGVDDGVEITKKLHKQFSEMRMYGLNNYYAELTLNKYLKLHGIDVAAPDAAKIMSSCVPTCREIEESLMGALRHCSNNEEFTKAKTKILRDSDYAIETGCAKLKEFGLISEAYNTAELWALRRAKLEKLRPSDLK